MEELKYVELIKKKKGWDVKETKSPTDMPFPVKDELFCGCKKTTVGGESDSETFGDYCFCYITHEKLPAGRFFFKKVDIQDESKVEDKGGL